MFAAGVPALGSSNFARDQPALSIGDASLPEGNSGTSTMSFPVTLSAASRDPVSVSFATADGTATAPEDYQATSGQLVFRPGETSKSIGVLINGDTVYEPDETFGVTLSNAVNATIGRAAAQGVILNDDQPPPPPPPPKCECSSIGAKVVPLSIHVYGQTTETWYFRTKWSMRCQSGKVPDCVGTVLVEPEPPVAGIVMDPGKVKIKCVGKECDAVVTGRKDFKLRVSRVRLKTLKQFQVKLYVIAACRKKLARHPYLITIVFRKGVLDRGRSDFNGDGKPDRK